VLSLSSAGETEAVLLGLDEQLTRFANNTIHQNVAESNRYVVVRAALGKRVGVGATNDLTDVGLGRAVETAIAAAKLQPENPDFPGLPDPVALPAAAGFDEATAGYSPVERARAVSLVCRRAEEEGCVASGAFRTAVHEYGVANSHGLFAYHPVTEADLTTVVMTDDSSGFASGASWKVAEVDVAALGDEAINKALSSRNPRPLEPGVYPVVLEPRAAQDLLETLSIAAGAVGVQEGRSWMSGRQGKQLMSPLIYIWDDGCDPSGWPMPFDFEGMARQRVDIVRQGVAGGCALRPGAGGQRGKGINRPRVASRQPFQSLAQLNPARSDPAARHYGSRG